MILFLEFINFPILTAKSLLSKSRVYVSVPSKIMSFANKSTLFSSPFWANSSNSSNEFIPVSYLHKPKKVPPPKLVPNSLLI